MYLFRLHNYSSRFVYDENINVKVLLYLNFNIVSVSTVHCIVHCSSYSFCLKQSIFDVYLWCFTALRTSKSPSMLCVFCSSSADFWYIYIFFCFCWNDEINPEQIIERWAAAHGPDHTLAVYSKIGEWRAGDILMLLCFKSVVTLLYQQQTGLINK